jgi:hypothetical protein
MQMLRLKTRKLFYNKWPYKIDIRLRKVNYVLRLGIDRTHDWLNGGESDKFIWRDANKIDIQEFVNKYQSIKELDLKFRTEGSKISIFLKDADLLDKVVDLFSKWVTTITEPSSVQEYDFLMSNSSKKVICDAFPKGKYRYRVYIKPKMNVNTRERFQSWMANYGDKFDVAASTSNWLSGNKHWVQDPFFYIDDQPMLSMVGMYLGDNVKRVEEFILRDKINI